MSNYPKFNARNRVDLSPESAQYQVKEGYDEIFGEIFIAVSKQGLSPHTRTLIKGWFKNMF